MQQVQGKKFVKVFLLVGGIIAISLISLIISRIPALRERTPGMPAVPVLEGPEAPKKAKRFR